VLRAAVLPTLRATPLAPAAACCLLSCGLLLVAGRPDRILGLLLVAILLTSVGAGFALDDEAAATLEASPTTLLTRRAVRAAGLLAVLAVGIVLQVTAAARVIPVHPWALGGWLLQNAAFVAVTLAVSAIAQRLLPERVGGTASAATGLVLLATVAALAKFDPWLSPVPGAPHSERWAWVLAGGVAVLAALSRDPARRFSR
jgi:hypothetical protein